LGFKVILSLDYHDPPPWVHENYPYSYYVNQFGERWTGDTFTVGDEVVLDARGAVEDLTPTDNGDANLVFNKELRGLVASYMKDVFADLGTDFWAVRLGGGCYGNVTYPPDHFGGKNNLYWAYDANAQRSATEAGIGDWMPGDPSPDGKAARFLNWYLDSLVGYHSWQIQALRQAGYAGSIMLLHPGRGIRPGDIEEATAANLDGSTLAEATGVNQSGHDFARQVGAIEDDNAFVTTTWLDTPASGDESRDPRLWSPVKYLSSLAKSHPLDLEVYGKNTGQGDEAAMAFSMRQMRRHGLTGMAWYNQRELFSVRYATLADYQRAIQSSQER